MIRYWEVVQQRHVPSDPTQTQINHPQEFVLRLWVHQVLKAFYAANPFKS